jgi:C4-dicarboxylate-specific signal transduction histidine kinase
MTEYVRERLTVIAEEASRAARIVQNLLVFARHYPPERRPTLLKDLVVRVLDLVAYQLEKDKIRTVTQFEDAPPLLVDEHQLQQVLLNLVQNAHHAMAKHRSERLLTVRVRATRQHAVIEVLDTGSGSHPRCCRACSIRSSPPSRPARAVGWPLRVLRHRDRARWSTSGREPSEGGAVFTIELPWGDARR